MRLHHLYVKRFMNLEELSVPFGNEDQSLYHDVSLRFFIGPNGSGKSHVVEALGLIFTALVNEYRPDLEFAVEYELRKQRILVIGTTNLPTELLDRWFGDAPPRMSPLHGVGVYLFDAETKRWIFQDPPRPANFAPSRIVGLTSGPTSGLQWAMFDRALAYFTEEVQAQYTDLGPEEIASLQEDTQARWDRMLDNPQTLVVDASDSRYAMLACLLLQNGLQSDKFGALLEEVHLHPTEALGAFSLEIRADWQELLAEPMRSRFAETLRKATRLIGRWPSGAMGADGTGGFLAVFDVTPPLREQMHQLHSDAAGLFQRLIAWKRRGVIHEVHLALQPSDPAEATQTNTPYRPHRRRKAARPDVGLMPEFALSDGEYLRLGRLGVLAMMARETESLLLLDEPETHFNDQWKVDFISDMVALLGVDKEKPYPTHEVILVTHSSITLSDADSDQVYAFERGKVLNAGKTFGGDLGDITLNVAGAARPRGSYALKLVEDAYAGQDRALLERLYRILAPGYLHMRVWEALKS